MNTCLSLFSNTPRLLAILFFLHLPADAQSSVESQNSDSFLWYITALVLLASVGVAIFILLKKQQNQGSKGEQKRKQFELVTAEKTPKFQRKTRPPRPKVEKTDVPELKQPDFSQVGRPVQKPAAAAKPKFFQIPVSTFKLKKPRVFEPLPDSTDDDLRQAIYKTQEGIEEDEEKREAAMAVIAKYKNRNAVDALFQISQYDVSAELRSKAVLMLAELDHESVFETILLACADPSRSVRAAGARGLFMLSFDRADAYFRIAECEDDFRIKRAAQAAVDADFVVRSLDRLVHTDRKIAYESFALFALLVKAGETKQIFDALRNHRDENVKMSLLQVLKTVHVESVLPDLHYFSEQKALTGDAAKMLEEVIESFESVAA